MSDIQKNRTYLDLINVIDDLYQSGRKKAIQTIQNELISTYWQIGRHIVEFEQAGNERANYGINLLQNLSKDLSLLHGKGFSRSNMTYMRLFYLRYRKRETVSHKLSWSHYFELLKIEKDELLIQYAMYGISSQLFVSKYQLYLPDEAELRQELAHIYEEE